MSENDPLNRYIKKDDPYIPVIRVDDNNTWDFAEMQKQGQRSWHSRPYEYKFAYDRLLAFHGDRGASGSHLDLACGASHPGYLVFAGITNIKEVYALDADPNLLRNGIDHQKVKKVLSDAKSMAFDSNYFDTLTCISALEHMPEWRAVLREAHRVLKPGGEFILTLDISVDPKLTLKHGVDGKAPKDYILECEVIGFNTIGTISYSSVDAVDLLNSRFPLYESESEMKEGQHRSLKAFRLCLKK